MRLSIGYAAALLVLGIGDFAWLGFIARSFVQDQVGALMLPRPNWVAAAIFYLLYPVALMVFAVPQADGAGPLRAALYGALFGFFAYATYDLTNLATLRGWTVPFAVVDVLWGTALSAAAAGVAAWASRAAS